MAHLFRHKENGKLYTIEHLKIDMRFANCGAFTGIHATPYKCEGKVISHTKQDYRDGKVDEFNPEKFVAETFDVVGEL